MFLISLCCPDQSVGSACQGNEWYVKSFSQNMEYILNVRSFFVLLIKWFWLSHALQYPHHGNRSFTFAFGWRLTFPSLWRPFLQSSFWTEVRMLCEKDEKRNSGTEWRIYSAMTSYRLPHYGNRSFAVALDDILPSYTGIMESAVRRSPLVYVVRLIEDTHLS